MQRWRFCPFCGQGLLVVREGERERDFCPRCRVIHYHNPVVGVAAVVRDEEERVLLGRRARGHWRGKWCIPCGYVEGDEDICTAVKREMQEETGLVIEVLDVITVLSNFHNPERPTVGIWFAAEVVGGSLRAGDDLDEVAFFPPQSPPPLAFSTDVVVLKRLAAFMVGR